LVRTSVRPPVTTRHRQRQQHDAAGVDAAGRAGRALLHLREHDDEDGDDQQRRQQQHQLEPVHEQRAGQAAGERADDGAGLQRRDDQAGGAAGAGGRVGPAPGAVVDERDLQRQPGHVEALQRPRGDEDGEARREGQHQARDGRHAGRDQQEAPMPVQVAELGQHRDDDGRQHQLGRLEPVDVRVVDVEVPRDVGQQRRVVALQDAAGELHEDQPADQAPGHGRPHRHAHAGPRRSSHPAPPPSREAARGPASVGRDRASVGEDGA